ncbi:uncharacterized protein EV422DRAFT_592270, partial [Fimicolochytrium jonesii]|uniref:uncharacterized protein n=1 Tax=Fimicolochytrium jonesii TaxID=1396493 RepID=UPI0022FE9B08
MFTHNQPTHWASPSLFLDVGLVEHSKECGASGSTSRGKNTFVGEVGSKCALVTHFLVGKRKRRVWSLDYGCARMPSKERGEGEQQRRNPQGRRMGGGGAHMSWMVVIGLCFGTSVRLFGCLTRRYPKGAHFLNYFWERASYDSRREAYKRRCTSSY